MSVKSSGQLLGWGVGGWVGGFACGSMGVFVCLWTFGLGCVETHMRMCRPHAP